MTSYFGEVLESNLIIGLEKSRNREREMRGGMKVMSSFTMLSDFDVSYNRETWKNSREEKEILRGEKVQRE